VVEADACYQRTCIAQADSQSAQLDIVQNMFACLDTAADDKLTIPPKPRICFRAISWPGPANPG
jgi:hypothetical protein